MSDSDTPLSGSKRRLLPDSGFPNSKKSRVFATTLEGLAQAGNPDGLAVNWGTSSTQQSTTSAHPRYRTPLEMGNHSQDIVCAEPGHRASDPIFIDSGDEDSLYNVSSAQQTPVSQGSISERSRTWRGVPQRHRKDGIADIDIKEVDIANVDLPSLNHGGGDNSPDASYIAEQGFPQDLSIVRRTNLISITNLPKNIDFRDISRLLHGCGFPSSVVAELFTSHCGIVAVRFNYPHHADAACFLLTQRAIPFPWKSNFGPLSVRRWPDAKQLPVRSSAETLVSGEPYEHSTETSYNPQREANSLYGGLRRDIYGDSSDDELPSSSPKISPMLDHSPCQESAKTSIANHRSCSLSSDSTEDEVGDGRNTSSTKSTNSGVGGFSSRLQIVPRKRRGYDNHRQPPVFADDETRPNRTTSIVDSVRNQPASAEVNDTAACRVPTAPHSRARRVLLPTSPNLPLVTISMRADAQFFDREKRHRISSYSMPCKGDYRHVEDACIIDDTVIVGYSDGPCQVSLIRMIEDQSPCMTELSHRPHVRPSKSGQNSTRGAALVSCLAPAGSLGKTVKFFTGGYDKSIKLWGICSEGRVTIESIIRVAMVPHALGARNRTLLFGTGKRLSMLDVDHPTAKPEAAICSNIIHQIHVHPEAPNISILELHHLDFQMQVYDDRKKHGFDRTPDCQFGYRTEGPTTSRYSRGSIYLSYFSKGYSDGCICIWDYRNAKRPVMKAKAQRTEPVVHTITTGSEIICFGKDTVTFLDHNGNSF